MTLVPLVPGPRQALDEGSVHDLAVDCAQVLLPATAATPIVVRPADGQPLLVVPESASAMLAGLSQYGS